MTEADTPVSGPDLTKGIEFANLADGVAFVGHVGDQAVLLARRGQYVLAVGAHCTQYGAPLAEGIIVGDTIRCPCRWRREPAQR